MKLIAFTLILISVTCPAQNTVQAGYDTAYTELKAMLEDRTPVNFKRAVYVTENAYLDNTVDFSKFNEQIQWLASKCLLVSKQGGLIYTESDREQVSKYAAVFKIMTDTIKFHQDANKYYSSIPFRYDFDDFFGEKDWTKMFVTKLLVTHNGNCHSLPFLYKILCEELGVKAHLSMAPNHTYIKLWSKKTGWYNTELTSGYFPIDAWIMASGYVHLNAVQNRVYMDTLSDKQSIAVCLVDLAKGYEKRFGTGADQKFIIDCCNTALAYYPQYVNGLVLKAETFKKDYEERMARHGVKYPSDLFSIPEEKKIFDEMQSLYLHIHQLGYRKMPLEMYLNWLTDIDKEKGKYLNKEIQNINTSTK